MVKYLGKTEHDLDLVTKSYLVQQLSNVTDDSALASALSSYIKSSDANNLVSELRSEVEEKLRAKVAKVDGKTLSANDFTNEFRQKLENLYTNDQIEQKIRDSARNVDLSQYMTQSNADNRYARNSQANTFTNNITIEHSLNDRSTSLFLKRGSHHYEFFTDAGGDFGVYDKRNNSTLLRLNNSTSQFYKDLNMNNKRITNVANATSGKDAVSRDYGDSRYARSEHTHTSSDISDSITRIGTHASANKLIKTDSDGFIDFIAPTDSSPDKTVVLKGYLDTKLGQKADSNHNHDSTYYQKTEYISDPGASDKANKPLKSNASGGLTLTNTPTENTDAVNKLYVDNKLADISLPDSGMTQAQADQRYSRTNHTHTSFDNLSIGNRLSFGDFGLQYDGGEFPSLTINHSESGNIMTARKYFVDFWKNFDIQGNVIKGLPLPTEDNHATNKQYVDRQVNTVLEGIPGALGAAGFISQEDADERYHQKSEHIDTLDTDSANKPIKADSNGYISMRLTPTHNNHLVNKSYVDNKVANINPPSSGITQEQADERYIRSNAATSTLGRHLTVDASNDGNYSASLFLKKNNHQYEFFTNAVGKFGAYDKTHSRTLFEADRNTFKHETNVDMSNNRIMNLPEPNGANQPATKSWTEGYVREQINGIDIPSAPNLSDYLTQSTADGRYARTDHTHVSADITDTITAIGTVASANKIVKTDSTGFLNIVAPTDSSPGKSIVLKSYLDEKLGQKADSNHTHTGYLSESDVTIDIGGRNVSSKVVKTGTDGQLNITADPTSDNHVVRKSYVDRKVREAGSSGGTVNGITQSTADSRYARTSHTHDSADITNTTNRIGTSASANKVVKLDSSGFLDVVTPNDNSPGNSVIVKSYMESKLNEKASTSELENLRSTVTQLQNKIRELEANAGKVKNSATNRYLDVWVGPDNQRPSDSTDKLVFVEKE